jgi:Domain of unknown function (DUF4349)
MHADPPPRRTLRRKTVAGTSAALGASACLLLAACSGGSSAASTAAAPAAGLEHSAAGRMAAPSLASGTSGVPRRAGLTTLVPAAGQSIIYTASLTVRAADVRASAARAAQLAAAAGGYVASEITLLDHAHPARSTVRIELKIPVAAYQSTLAALGTRLGTRISQSQQAQDVTLTVADVSSRVASAQAAIAQLRKLLARAGSVSSLLMVQDQINSEQSDLEALQSQQRALTHETTYGTVTIALVSRQAPPAARPVKLAGGFTGGLAAGWRALRQVTSWLLTAVGAILPFGVFVVVAVYLGYRGRRRLTRRRAGPDPAK